MFTLPSNPHNEHCPSCGAAVAGGQAGCQTLYDELSVRAYAGSYAAGRDLGFDAYCMQHVETYCRSAKSYAAHLTRLCCGIEFGGDPQLYAALQRWLNGPVVLQKPALLMQLGELTIVDVYSASSPAEYLERVQAWATAVWVAYASQHALARAWVQQAHLNHR